MYYRKVLKVGILMGLEQLDFIKDGCTLVAHQGYRKLIYKANKLDNYLAHSAFFDIKRNKESIELIEHSNYPEKVSIKSDSFIYDEKQKELIIFNTTNKEQISIFDIKQISIKEEK